MPLSQLHSQLQTEREPLDTADEIIILLARIIVIGVAAVYYEEVYGLLVLLLVSCGLIYEGRRDN